jgi:arylsulfatase A-like enzyme
MPSRPPNVIVIMADQQKATSSHLWGNSFCETPALAAMAEQGVLFDCAITPHPLCGPARQSLWTSQYPHSHGGRRNQTLMPSDAVHAFKVWKEAGYHNGLIGKNHCFVGEQDLELFDTWCEVGHGGITEDSTRGMEWFRDREGIDAAHDARQNMTPQSPRFSYDTNEGPLEDSGTGLVAGQTVRFLEQHRQDPFALWVSFPDPHEPWVCPKSYADQFPPEKVGLPPQREGEFDDAETVPERNRVLHAILGTAEDSAEDVLALQSVYYGMVKFLDDGLAQITEALDRLGLRENTIVVYCSDHGDFMGEHGMQCKGGVFYDCLTRVPLVVSWPGHIPSGIREDNPVNLIDIVPTVLGLQGLDVPPSMHGEALPSVVEGAPTREVTFSEYGAGGPAFTMADLEQMEHPFGRRALMQSLQWREAEGRRKMARTRDWKYVHDPMGDLDELYDLKNDPWELTNVAHLPEHAAVISTMRGHLADWSIRTEDAKAVPMPESRS